MRYPVKRSTRLLQLFSLSLLGLGTLLILPIPLLFDGLSKVCAILAICTGVTGVLGLSLTWYRALSLFTMLTWVVSIVSITKVVLLIIDCMHHDSCPPFAWIVWLLCTLTSLPAAVLSSTMHLLRVWRQAPAITETSEPLVAAAADGESTAVLPVTITPGASRPIWPPPGGGAGRGAGGASRSGEGSSVSVSGDDLRAAGRVAAVAHQGEGAFSAGDLAKAARVRAAAATMWPPPPA